MMKNQYRLLILLCAAMLFANGVFAQKKQRSRAQKAPSAMEKAKNMDSFFRSQFWIGMKGGANYTKALPTNRHAVFVSTAPVAAEGSDPATAAAPLYEKQYVAFELREPSTQIGLMATYNFKTHFSVSFQPTYTNMNFAYKTAYKWAGQDNNNLELNQTHRFSMGYVELPLLLRFDPLRKRLRPYLQAGAFYGRLLKADKSVDITSLDNASGAQNPIENTAPIIGAQRLFIPSHWGWVAGGGVNYDFGNVRLGLDAQYKYGMNNVTDVKNRYTDNRMTGMGDVMDDMKLRNLAISFTVLMPMKFLETSTYKATKP